MTRGRDDELLFEAVHSSCSRLLLGGHDAGGDTSGAGAQSMRICTNHHGAESARMHSSSQGYLGVLVADVDNDSASKLKLKEVRGAVITLIDHDAPAAQAGLRVNDVVLEMNGQTVEGAEQFGRMMREIPPGRKVSLVISRDGNTQTIGVELADRKKMEQRRLEQARQAAAMCLTPALGMGIFRGNGSGGDAPASGGFHMPFSAAVSMWARWLSHSPRRWRITWASQAG